MEKASLLSFLPCTESQSGSDKAGHATEADSDSLRSVDACSGATGEIGIPPARWLWWLSFKVTPFTCVLSKKVGSTHGSCKL